MEKYTLDATGKKIGRVATEAAKLLMGKNRTDFARNIVPNVQVDVVNTSKADISVKKLSTELHARFSGFPSGITVPTIGKTIEKKGHKELFRLAINGMLPRNKLRAKMMKHLKITE